MYRNFIRSWALLGLVALFASACSEHAGSPLAGPGGSSAGAQTDIKTPGDYDINGAKWTARYPFGVGTGLIDPFLTLQNSPSQHAFNTDASPLPLDAKRPQFTDKLPLNNVPIIVEGGEWREFILDANENKSGTGPHFSIDQFDLWVCQDPGAPTFSQISHFEANANCTKIYNIDANAPLLATSDNTSGSGNTLDYRILIPASYFGQEANDACPYNPTAADCGYYIILYTRMGYLGGDYITEATFEEFSTIRRGFVAVSKTANTSLTRTTTRTWTWTIDKEILAPADNPALIQQNQPLDIQYRVTLNASSNDVVVDSDWLVQGQIFITNPSNDAVTIVSVSDVISHAVDPDINASVSCPVSFPHQLNSGGSLTCTYSQSLPNGDLRSNRAGVELSDLATAYSPNVPVDFSSATVNAVLVEIDECVNVTDLLEINGVSSALPPSAGAKPSGQYCAASGLPKIWNYTLTITPDLLECEENTVDNTAEFTTNDTQTTGSDDASQEIYVECEEGCTLTQGYWKTHADATRKQFDETWNNLPQGPNTTFYLSGQSWIQVFNTSVGGNQYYALAHQYMAAVLNGFNVPNPPASVVSALSQAHDLFNTYTPAQIGALKGSQAPRPLFVSLAATLASYNEGLIGPGHCTEQ